MEQEQKVLTITRLLNAPRALVFKLWTDPKHLAKWWGPQHFTNPVCEVDVRAGGSIYILMQAPDGSAHPMDGKYTEVIEPEKLVFSARALNENQQPVLEVLNTVLFEEDGAKTKLTMTARVIKVTPKGQQNLDGMNVGWTQSIDRLQHLAENF